MSTQEKKALASALVAGNRALGIVPSTFEDCYRMAKLFSQTALVPKDYQGNPEATCVAIMQGLEVGLSPMAALQSIAVINGRPSIWGDGALALVRASGLVEAFEETDDGETATCTIKRRGEAAAIVRKFSMADAKRAGLAGKSGPWASYPQRMRQMRARSWAMRDGFADVLKGLSIADETQDIAPMRDVTPAKSVPLALDFPDIPDGTEDQSTPDVKVPDAEFLAHLDIGYAATKDLDTLNEVYVANELEIEERGIQQMASDLYEKHRTRIYDAMS